MAVTYESTREMVDNQSQRWLKFLRDNASIILIYTIILLVIGIAALSNENFRSPSNLVNILRQSIILGLIAIGQSVIALTGGLDMSVAQVARIVGLTVATIFAAEGSNPDLIIPLIILGLLIGMAIGLFNGILITRTHANPFIITLGIASILRGVNLAISSTPIRGIPKAYLLIYDYKIGIVPANVLVMALIWVIAYIFATRTRTGRAFFAVGGSERVARLSAISYNRTLVVAHTFCSVCAALTGLFLLARTGVGDPSAAEGMDFQSIVAVALGGISLYGGRGSMIGTLGGVLLLATLSNVFNLLQVNIYYQQLFLGLIVLITVAAYKSPRAA
ncbi:MAG: ABC transporter permease [Anaerolineales bacterium]|nr:ABC transporter permease [Anaerolineales bacterium]